MMSERFDNQKQSSGNFRHLLQQHVDKINPRRLLTSEEAKRLARLETIAGKLKRGENAHRLDISPFSWKSRRWQSSFAV